jgi:hypothetical protein
MEIGDTNVVQSLMDECDEIIAITGSSIKTAKQEKKSK